MTAEVSRPTEEESESAVTSAFSGESSSADTSLDNLLSLEQSAHLAGVTGETIKQYCDIGLLKPRMKNEKQFFVRDEIKGLFYTRSNFVSEESLKQRTELEALKTEDASLSSGDKEKAEPVKTAAEAPEGSGASEKPDASLEDKEGDQSKVESKAAENTSSKETYLLQLVDTLKESVELLREERDWLRQRIEHLEYRGEREQMLLLAESETVRRLIGKPSWTERLKKLEIPWLGFGGSQNK